MSSPRKKQKVNHDGVHMAPGAWQGTRDTAKAFEGKTFRRPQKQLPIWRAKEQLIAEMKVDLQSSLSNQFQPRV